jgi:hypothetical protein
MIHKIFRFVVVLHGDVAVLVGLLVQVFPTVLGSAETMDLLVLDGELVVVGDLLTEGDRLLRVDDDLLLAVDRDDLGIAVWLKHFKQAR